METDFSAGSSLIEINQYLHRSPYVSLRFSETTEFWGDRDKDKGKGYLNKNLRLTYEESLHLFQVSKKKG